ncbi:MAG: tetratricopeptide repeat protein [Verrucomicrobiales bacterium]|nr:tetratricopeptide repeat protein [Verrucomicrobiales bacterium]
MIRLALWLLVFGAALSLRAQQPDTEFLQIYDRIQQGETLEKTGQASSALDQYQAASKDLERFAKVYPNWNQKIVQFRKEFLADKLGSLRSIVPTPTPNPAAPTKDVTPAVPPTDDLSLELAATRERLENAEARVTHAETRATAAQQAASQNLARANELGDRASQLALELRQSRDRVEVLEAANQNLERTRERLESDRTTLQAKLQEALSPKPAAIDPAELAKAEERNRLLMKENEILKAGLERQMADHQKLLETAKRALEFEQQLQIARAELSAQKKEIAGLRQEREKLQAKLDAASRKSNDEVAASRPSPSQEKSTGPADSTTSADLAALRLELADQRSKADELRRENATLLRDLERLTAIRVTPASLTVSEVSSSEVAAAEVARVRRLERERDELERDLQIAKAELKRRDPSMAEARAQRLAQEVAALTAQVRTLEAKPEPYSAEELALFRAPETSSELRPVQVAQATPGAPAPSSGSGAGTSGTTAKPAETPTTPASPATNTPKTSPADATPAPNSTNAVPSKPGAPRRRTVSDLPAGAGILAAQAQRAFAQRRLDEAEKAYREILKLDENNVYTLGNLGAILVEKGDMQEAETFANRALQIDPDDPFSLSLIGMMRFRQQKLDEAFSILSRSAQIDPTNPQTQNYLGITLVKRGQRKAGEAALRLAIKMDPNFASAHYNLAVVYANQQPPFLELARFHYQKARRAGEPANPAFEALLKGAPESSPTP